MSLSAKAISAELIDYNMSRKFKVMLAVIIVVVAYKLFVGGDTATVEYETSD
jgi:hypothetical protein